MMNIFVKHPDKKQFNCKKAVKQLKSSEEKEFIKSLQLMFEDFRIINYIPNSTTVLKI